MTADRKSSAEKWTRVVLTGPVTGNPLRVWFVPKKATR